MIVTDWCWQVNPEFRERPRGSDGASLPVTAEQFAEAQAAALNGFCEQCAHPLDRNPWVVHRHVGKAASEHRLCSELCVQAWLAEHGTGPTYWDDEDPGCGCHG